ncbi:MAG TPA: VOC family protein [Acidimicrobiales bacterium]
MSIELNHTIVVSNDAEESSGFLAEILGLSAPVRMGRFHAVQTTNGVSLDFVDVDHEVVPQHYAFLVDESAFDEIHGRITDRGLTYWADPAQSRPNEINTDDGRRLYFLDPDGHYLEILTVPYKPW